MKLIQFIWSLVLLVLLTSIIFYLSYEPGSNIWVSSYQHWIISWMGICIYSVIIIGWRLLKKSKVRNTFAYTLAGMANLYIFGIGLCYVFISQRADIQHDILFMILPELIAGSLIMLDNTKD